MKSIIIQNSLSTCLLVVALVASLSLVGCGGGGRSDDPVPPRPEHLTEINANNMLEVAGLAAYERQQSNLVVNAYRLLPLWFSTGQVGNEDSKCSVAGGVNYSQNESGFALSANKCTHSYAGKIYALTSGAIGTVLAIGGGKDDFDLTYNNWNSSLNNPIDSANLLITGRVSERHVADSKFTRTGNYAVNKNGEQIDVSFTDKNETRIVGQSITQVLVAASANIRTKKFFKGLSIDLPNGAPSDESHFIAGTLTITSQDKSSLSMTPSGARILIELRPTGTGAPSVSQFITTTQLEVEMKKVL